MKKDITKNNKRVTKDEMYNRVVRFVQNDTLKTFNYKQVGKAIGAKKIQQLEQIEKILQELKLSSMLLEVSTGRYKLNDRGNMIEGIFDRKSNGRNHVVPSDGGDPIAISDRNAQRALKGDYVSVRLYAKRRGQEQEGEIVEVLKQSVHQFVGTIEVFDHYAFLLTESKVLANDIFIPKDKIHGATTGQKVVVRVTEWPERARNPHGEVVDILGMAGENNAEIHAILAEFGLPYKYPEEVDQAANEIPDKISQEEISKRRDMRGVATFTIDPKDAKDFDDALSVKMLENGNWEIGVHIADVTHYVRPGDIIDREAESRATSVYLVDRVVPMLPEHLSNGLCSLRPNEEKLCFSAVFELTEQAEVVDSWIGKTVIYSDRRFSYEEAQEILENGKGEYCEELLMLNSLAKQLRDQRFSSGAINFERHEVRFEIDEKGKPVSVYFKVAKDANKLIEEFMLLANRTVAERIGRKRGNKKPKTFVYRVHDLPDPDKMENFAEFIRRFGYQLKTDGSKSSVSKQINKLLDTVQGKREENLIETIAIRAMAKAVYTTQNIGHYGLAFDFYTHFTSPIRRYPDMMVHRLLEQYLEDGHSVDEQEYEKKCEHSSSMEQLAANAERASIKYKQVEYMSERLGKEFEGVISGVTEWGLYVELNENKCEGMIPIRDLDDDYYEFDDRSYALIGRRNKKIYRLGDPIVIQVAKANLEKKQLDFALIEK